MRAILILYFLLPCLAMAQHKGVSYELRNEIGTFKLFSITYSHKQDNTEGITYVTDKNGKDTLYQLNKFLNGYVGLSNDGNTIVHFVTEKDGIPLAKSILTFYRLGKKFDSAEFGTCIKYELEQAIKNKKLPKSGWLKNDSLIHKMANSPFYITDDKVFISMDKPQLLVFNMNQMFHIYTGNGANHFFQNYYSIPNAPYRELLTSEEYQPSEKHIKQVKEHIIEIQGREHEVHVTLKIMKNGTSEVLELWYGKNEISPGGALLTDAKSHISRRLFESDFVPEKTPYWIYQIDINPKVD